MSCWHDPDAHGVDERIPVVRGIEEYLATDRGNSEAIAIPADAANNVVEEVAIAGLIERSKAKRVQDGYRASTHCENVADDATDASCRTFVRFDRAGVVVRFNLEDDRQTLANVDRARVLAWTLQTPRELQLVTILEQRSRVLVAAVLAPHCAEHAEFNRTRLASEQLNDAGGIRHR